MYFSSFRPPSKQAQSDERVTREWQSALRARGAAFVHVVFPPGISQTVTLPQVLRH
jgi:hypothetical protein